jgi:AraC family transcriptional regulator, ethanolamine operon transcriptional activator
MLTRDLAIAQPAVTIVEIDDPTMTGAGIDLVDMDAVQLQSMPLRVRRVIVRLEAVTLVYHSTNARMRTRTSVREGRLAYVTFGPRALGSVNGLPVFPGLMLAVEPAAEGHFVVDPGYEAIAFLVHPQDIADHLAARGREADFRPPSGVEALQVDAGRVRALYDWGRRLVDIAAREPRSFEEGRKERAAAQVEGLETLLATLGAASGFEPTRSDRTRQAHSLIVKAAEDHALSRVDDPLQVTDLCRAAGVSERTLEYAFKEVMGLTPVNYLMRLRLHRVRQALLAATQASSTVSAEALKWGFWHFGEFSRAYKACFGELPSDTLRRAPGEEPRETDGGVSAQSHRAAVRS